MGLRNGMRDRISEERFWSKVERRRPGECWPWSACVDRDGYGAILLLRPKQMTGAHRIAYALSVGEVPPGKCVCHRCDNPPCCNPGHLFLGTNAENQADKIAKGRGLDGERHGRSKLSAAEVSAIRFLRQNTTFTRKEIAMQFGVTRGHVGHIERGLAWRGTHGN